MAVNDMAVSNPQTTRAGRRHLGWVLGLPSTAYFMVVLDSVVVTTALPRMQRDLHACPRPCSGRYRVQHRLRRRHHHRGGGRDRFGRRRVFTAGLALFTAASAACALAPDAPVADRRPHRAGPGRRDRLAAESHDLDDCLPRATARDDRRHLRRARRAGGRGGPDRRRRAHPGNRLALDLLDQRADRGRRPAACGAAPAREPRRPGTARPARGHARDRWRRRDCLGPGPRGTVGLDKRRGRRLPGLRRCPAARLRRLGTARQRADGAAAAVPQPRVHGRQRHHLPHDGRDLRRRLPRHRRVPARPRLLAGLGRGAAAPVLRHADADLPGRGRGLRPRWPPAGHGDRALPAGCRPYLGRGQGAHCRRAGRSWTSPC